MTELRLRKTGVLWLLFNGVGNSSVMLKRVFKHLRGLPLLSQLKHSKVNIQHFRSDTGHRGERNMWYKAHDTCEQLLFASWRVFFFVLFISVCAVRVNWQWVLLSHLNRIHIETERWYLLVVNSKSFWRACPFRDWTQKQQQKSLRSHRISVHSFLLD